MTTDARGSADRRVRVGVDHNGVITIAPEAPDGDGPSTGSAVLITLEVVGGFLELVAGDGGGGGGGLLRATILEREDALEWIRLVFGDAVFVAAEEGGRASDDALRTQAALDDDRETDSDRDGAHGRDRDGDGGSGRGLTVSREAAPLAADAERLLAGLWVRRAWPRRGTRVPRLDVGMLDGELALLAARCEALFAGDEPAIELLESYFSRSASPATAVTTTTTTTAATATTATAAERLRQAAETLLQDIAPWSAVDVGAAESSLDGPAAAAPGPDADDASEPVDLASRRALIARVDALRASVAAVTAGPAPAGNAPAGPTPADAPLVGPVPIGPFVAETAAVAAAVAATAGVHGAPPVVGALDRRTMAASDDSSTDSETRFDAAGVDVVVAGSGPSTVTISLRVPSADALPLDIVTVDVRRAGDGLDGSDTDPGEGDEGGRRLVVLGESADDDDVLTGAISVATESERIEVEVAPPAAAPVVLADETWFAAIGPSLRGAGVEQRSRWRRLGAPLADGARLKEEIRRALIEG